MSKKKFFLAGVIALACGVTSMTAQVTIGSDKSPEAFSVLELISNNVHGLRLPHLTTQQRDNITTTEFKANSLAEGLTIFNIDTKCVETWNGTAWIGLCAMCGDIPCMYIECSGQNLQIPVFAKTNLGADPTLDTPKKQMTFLAGPEAGGGTTTNVTTRNGRVFGGRYQWGRANLPYAISTDGNYTLYTGATNSIKLNDIVSTATYNASTGQIETTDGITTTDNLHVFVNPALDIDGAGPLTDTAFDWRLGDNATPVDAVIGRQRNDLWDSNGGIQGGTPSKSINDPCPSGWRIPTQEDWERLGAYDCNPAVAGGTFNPTVDGTSPDIGGVVNSALLLGCLLFVLPVFALLMQTGV